MAIDSNLTVDDVMENPTKFGLPSFQDFAKDPGKYTGNMNWLMGLIDRGSELLNGYHLHHEYKFKNWKCKSLEEIEQVAKDEGVEFLDLDFKAEIIDVTNKHATIVVEFFSKAKKSSLLVGV